MCSTFSETTISIETTTSIETTITKEETSTVKETTSMEETSTVKQTSTPQGSTTDVTVTNDDETTEMTVDFSTGDDDDSTLENYSTFSVQCYRGVIDLKRNESNRGRLFDEENGSIPISEREHDNYDTMTINLMRPPVTFHFVEGKSENEIEINFDGDIVGLYNNLFLIYYPGTMETHELSEEEAQQNVNCRIVFDSKLTIADLSPSNMYTFCAILRYQIYISPFQCKSNQNHHKDREPWLYEEQKVFESFFFFQLSPYIKRQINFYFDLLGDYFDFISAAYNAESHCGCFNDILAD